MAFLPKINFISILVAYLLYENFPTPIRTFFVLESVLDSVIHATWREEFKDSLMIGIRSGADLGTSIDLKSVDQVTTNQTWQF